MLPISRVLATLLTGLGIALIVGGLVAPRFLIGDGRLPLDLEHTTWTLHDPQGTHEGETEPVTRQIHLEIQNPADNKTASVRVGDTLRAGTKKRDFDNLVSASTWSYTMDRTTGEPEGEMRLSSIMGMLDVTVDGAGSWLKLPANVKQEDYEVFDPVLRGTAPAQFTGEDEIGGRKVYRFTQTIKPTNIATRYADIRNTKTIPGPDEQPIRAFYFHSAEREFAVDQVSGLVVDIDEKVADFYGDAQGRKLEDVIAYDASMAPEQSEQIAGQLGSVFSQSQSRMVTLGVIGLGAVLALLGALGALLPAKKRSRHAKR